MKIIKAILTFIVSLCLVLTLFVAQFSLFTVNKLFDSDLYINKFESAGLYPYIETSLNKDFATIARTCNFPKSVFDGVIQTNWIKSQVIDSTRKTIDYMNYTSDSLPQIDTTSIGNNFSANLDKFINSSNSTVGSASDLAELKTDVQSTINNDINLVSFNKISKLSFFQKFRHALNLLYKYNSIIMLSILLLILILFFIQYKDLSYLVAWLGCSFVAGGLLTFIPSIVGILSKFTQNIAIGVPMLKTLTGSIINEYISFFAYTGGTLIFTGIILLILYSKFGAKKETHRHRHSH
ncbi:hypothetical protein IAI10_16855 [Clostridium sp. 19966]|uniref:hypothetical protein n=1 Tax=Clostridium sp. 19966 TaxID=2768166 RepID=UPI0028DE732C|nr:hypothetical protein [Clostridium sp. 19966]MDT8718338.1 hypothetical protein [Clostridium sp. 19966]